MEEDDERYLNFLKRISGERGCYEKQISCLECPLRGAGGSCKALIYMFENHPDSFIKKSSEKIGYYARMMIKIHSKILQWKRLKQN